MKIKKLSLILLLPLIIGVTSCSVEGGKNSSSSSLASISTSSQTSSQSSQSSKNDVLPEDSQEFIDAVNLIILNDEAWYYINEAFDLFENLENWDYPEVLEAFDKLEELEELYNEYISLYNVVEAFLDKVDAIPYELTLASEKYIISAEETYAKLTDVQKEMLGVKEAYNRLVEARNEFDALYAQILEEAKNQAANNFISKVSLIPEVSLITLKNADLISNAIMCYDELSDEVKEMEGVIEAYETLTSAKARYDELVANPELSYSIEIQAFAAAVNDLPETSSITLSDREAIFNAREQYKALPLVIKENTSVVENYGKVINTLKAYYSVYLDSVGETYTSSDDKDVTLISNAEELLAIANNLSGSYKLVSDIDLSNIDWTANLGIFTGTLDGNGFAIYNLNSSGCEDATFALFLEVQTNATVKNLTLEGSATNPGAWSGSIAIRNFGLIENCLVKLTVTSSNNHHTGGIACENKGAGIIRNCLVLSTISCGNFDGGIVVGNYATITNSYFLASNISTGYGVGNNGTLTTLGKTEEELTHTSTYDTWDKSIWCLIDGYYPTLVLQ